MVSRAARAAGHPPGEAGDASARCRTGELLLAVLRASLGAGDPPAPALAASCDWARFQLLAAHHGLVPLLCAALEDLQVDAPQDLRRRWKVAQQHNALRNEVLQRAAEEICTTLGKRGISVLLLKGAALLRTLYHDPSVRRLTDIDLLVDEHKVSAAAAELERLGFQAVTSAHADERGPLCDTHLAYLRPGTVPIPVELHWRLFESYHTCLFDLGEVWRRARPLPGMPAGVSIMSPEHELAHLCLHLERHSIAYRSLVKREDWLDLLLLPQGHGLLMWLYDIALYVQRRAPTIDWESFVATARRWVIDEHLYATLELCRRALGTAPPPEVMSALRGKAPRLAERIAHRAVLASRHANEATGRSTNLRATVAAHLLRLVHAWVLLFPSSRYLRARYPERGWAIARWAKHFRAVVPGLWAETRQRLGASGPAGEPGPKGTHD